MEGFLGRGPAAVVCSHSITLYRRIQAPTTNGINLNHVILTRLLTR